MSRTIPGGKRQFLREDPCRLCGGAGSVKKKRVGGNMVNTRCPRCFGDGKIVPPPGLNPAYQPSK